MCIYTGNHNLDTNHWLKYLQASIPHCQLMTQCIEINEVWKASSQRLCCMKEFSLAPRSKFCPWVTKKPFPDVLVTVTHTVLPTIISGFLYSTVPLFPCILAWINEALVFLPICQCLARCVLSIVVLIRVYGKINIVDVGNIVFESEEDCWVYRYHRYHVNRKLLMFLDRVFDIVVIGLFIFYYLKSIPYWPVCFVICISSRLISFALIKISSGFNTTLSTDYPMHRNQWGIKYGNVTHFGLFFLQFYLYYV